MEIQDTSGEFEGKLPYELRKNRFDYKLVKRTKEVAMYAQYNDDNTGRILAYEVFKVIWKKGAVINNIEIKAGEKFPGDGDFGKTAYSSTSLERAEGRYQELLDQVKLKNNI